MQDFHQNQLIEDNDEEEHHVDNHYSLSQVILVFLFVLVFAVVLVRFFHVVALGAQDEEEYDTDNCQDTQSAKPAQKHPQKVVFRVALDHVLPDYLLWLRSFLHGDRNTPNSKILYFCISVHLTKLLKNLPFLLLTADNDDCPGCLQLVVI